MAIRQIFYWITLIATCFVAGCITSAERIKLNQMQEHRVRTNLSLKEADTQGILRKTALADPDFERVYYARIKDVSDKRAIVYPQVRKNV